MDGQALKNWLVARLTDERAEADWAGLLEAGFEALLDSPFAEVVPDEAGRDAARALVQTDHLADLVRPSAKLVIPLILAHAREDRAPLGRWVPEEARHRIEALAARPGWVAPEWVQALYAQKAMEELVADTLYRSLRDFSTIVPRIVQSVMPSPLGKLAKLGGKATGGVGGRVLDEVERRLEGEIKRFLEKGTRRALDGAARFTVDHIDGPSAAQAKKELVGFVLDHSAAFHVGPLDDAAVAEIDAIAELVARHVAAAEETGAIVEATADRIFERFEGGTVRDAFEACGITERPPYEAWAASTWPAIPRIVAAPGIDAWLGTLCEQIVSEVAPASPE